MICTEIYTEYSTKITWNVCFMGKVEEHYISWLNIEKYKISPKVELTKLKETLLRTSLNTKRL